MTSRIDTIIRLVVVAAVLLLFALAFRRTEDPPPPSPGPSVTGQLPAHSPASPSGQRPAAGIVGSPRSQEPTQDISTALEAGLATWFDSYGSGLYAAVPSYSWGDPHYQVTVCRQDDGSRCVVVEVLDCLCSGSDIVIDLSRDAFARLEDPSRGKVAVTVESGGGPGITLPPTDVSP